MSHGIWNLKKQLKRAAELGASVELVPRSGEVRVISGDTRLNLNNRRKTGDPLLQRLIRNLEEG